MEDALERGLATVATFVPRLLLFLVILVIGFIIAKVLAKAVNAILERVGFDRAIERGGIAVRNYVQNLGGAAKVSHAVLGGTPLSLAFSPLP